MPFGYESSRAGASSISDELSYATLNVRLCSLIEFGGILHRNWIIWIGIVNTPIVSSISSHTIKTVYKTHRLHRFPASAAPSASFNPILSEVPPNIFVAMSFLS
jgi:hypothetical protein